MKNSERIVWLAAVTNQDVERVGGKNASLGELMGALKQAGIRVPDGFAITASAYREFVAANQLTPQIQSQLLAWEEGKQPLEETGNAIRRLLRRATFSDALAGEIRQAYRDLSDRYNVSEVDVAVRSSATAEDCPMRALPGSRKRFSISAAKMSF